MSCAIPGGCLCCTGEEDFQQQLGKLVRERPARILIEPSGIAHPGAVIDELRAYERAGLLRLMSTIALVDVPRLGVLQSEERTTEREQVEAADVVLLSKAELASPLDRERFWSAARDLFPAKRWIGLSSAGVLPPEALQPPQAAHSFELVAGQPAVACTFACKNQRTRVHARRPCDPVKDAVPVGARGLRLEYSRRGDIRQTAAGRVAALAVAERG